MSEQAETKPGVKNTDTLKTTTSRTKKKTKTKLGNRRSISSFEEEQVQYYERLLYAVKKGLHKDAKTVRNFECQRLIRKIKDSKDKDKDNSSSMEEQLLAVKQLNLDEVVHESLRRLGILHLNPTTTTTSEEATTTTTTTSSSPTPLVELLLKHKRLQLSLEEWNEKVTEYRRWSLKKQEQHSTSKFSSPPPPPPTAVTNKSLFVQLGGETKDTAKNPYGPGADEADDPFPKKNRKGQRARRAKAMALQAKKDGTSVRAADSLNWRKPKTNSNDNNNNRNNNNSSNNQQKQEPPEESLHPSWAAAKKDSSGIVQFQGTKITFD